MATLNNKLINFNDLSHYDEKIKEYIEGQSSTANNGTLTIQKNGSNVATFTANQATNTTANIVVPTKPSDIGALAANGSNANTTQFQINSNKIFLGNNDSDSNAGETLEANVTLFKYNDSEVATHNWVESNEVFEKGDANNSGVLKGQSNQALSQASVSLGKENLSGLRGWYYNGIRLASGSTTRINVYLSDTQVVPEWGYATRTTSFNPMSVLGKNTIISLVNDSKYDNKFKIVNGDAGMVQLEAIDENGQAIEVPFDSIKAENNLSPEDYTIYCLSQPTKGPADIGYCAFATGVNNQAINVATTVFGTDNIAYGKLAIVGGKNNKGGYNTVTFGANNENIADNAFVAGTNIDNTGNNSFITGNNQVNKGKRAHLEGNNNQNNSTGMNNHIEGENNVIETGTAANVHLAGVGNKTSTSNQTVVGKYNKKDSNALLIVGRGSSDAARANAFEAGYDSTNGDFIKVGTEILTKAKLAAMKNPADLTFGSKKYDGQTAMTITAADLGLSGAMKFLGTSSTAISDGSTTQTITVSGSSITVSAGNVVLYGGYEYVWTGSAWEQLGQEGSFKTKQDAVPSPTASGSTTAFIDTISQDANGKITATKKSVSFPVTSVNGKTGVVTLAKGDIGLGNVENKSSATIRAELTKTNVTNALGYTPPTTNTTYDGNDFLAVTVSGDMAEVSWYDSGVDFYNGLYASGEEVATQNWVNNQGFKKTDNNTTYTLATGDSNGQIKVTPSSGSAYNVSVKGLGSAAYTASTAYAAASHGNHVPATQTANNAKFLRNDNTWQTVTPANIGAAASSHTHTKSQITDFPTSMPASDVYSWAKSASKPSYTASEVGAVPTTRTVNGKALSSNITLTAADVGAGTSNLTIGTTATTAAAGNHTHNYLPLSGGTMTNSIITPKNDNMGIIPAADEYGQIGASDKKFFRMYAYTFYGNINGGYFDGEDSYYDLIHSGNIGSQTVAKAGTCTGNAATATSATKATQDGNGNNIASTYATKASLKTVATTGSYNDLSNKPTIPAAANNGTLTIQKNGTTVATFGANQSSNATANIVVPTKTSDLTNNSDYVTSSWVSDQFDSELSTVGKTGSYNDLSNKPTIPTKTSQLTNDSGFKTTDNNTTYTFATGDSNGQIKVTPSSGSAYNISVKGLGSAAYTNATTYATIAALNDLDDRVSAIEGSICLQEGTQILMADGTTKNIENVKYGDMIMTYDIDNNEAIPCKSYGCMFTGYAHTYNHYCFDNGSILKVFGGHRLYDADKQELVYFSKMNIGDHAMTPDCVPATYCYSPTKVPASVSTRKFTLFCETGLYFANNILCGHPLCQPLDLHIRTHGAVKLSDEDKATLQAYADARDNDYQVELSNPEYVKEAMPFWREQQDAKRKIQENKDGLAARDYKTIKAMQGKLTEEEITENVNTCEELRAKINEEEEIVAKNKKKIKALQDKYNIHPRKLQVMETINVKDAIAKARAKYKK